MDEAELIEKYEGLIYKVAKRFYNVELADLYQAGCIGLIKASRKFNKEEGTDFISYAYMHIFGEMYELANKSRDIKLNKLYLKIYKELEKVRSNFLNTMHREPSTIELSELTGFEESIIIEVLTLTKDMISLDAEYESLNGTTTVMDSLGEEPNFDDKILLEESLDSLEPLEQDVIKIRYFNDLTQTETAKVLGISQVKVSRVEQKGKQKILEYIRS